MITERWRGSGITGLIIHCNEDPIYVFLFWELRGLSLNFHIHVSVSDLYIPRIRPHIPCSSIQADRSWEYINRSQTHECGNWDCCRAIPFLRIFVSNFRYWFFAVQEFWRHNGKPGVKTKKPVASERTAQASLTTIGDTEIHWQKPNQFTDSIVRKQYFTLR